MRPTSQWELAFPDFHKYFLAAQLFTALWWLDPDVTNSAVLLEAAVVQSLKALKFLLFRGPCAPCALTPSMITTLRAWRAGLRLERYPAEAHSPNAPLWCKPNLAQIYTIPEPHA